MEMDAGTDIMQGEIKLDCLLKSKKKRRSFKPPVTRAKRQKTLRNVEHLDNNAVTYEEEPTIISSQEEKKIIKLKREINPQDVNEDNTIERIESNLKDSDDTEILSKENNFSLISNKLIKTLDLTFFDEDENHKLSSLNMKNYAENSNILDSDKYISSRQISNSQLIDNEMDCDIKEIKILDEVRPETSSESDEVLNNIFQSTKDFRKDERKCTDESESDNTTVIRISEVPIKMNCVLKEIQTMEEICTEVNSTTGDTVFINSLTTNSEKNEEKCIDEKDESNNFNEKETVVLGLKTNISTHLQSKDSMSYFHIEEIHTDNSSEDTEVQMENIYINTEHCNNLTGGKTEGLDAEKVSINEKNKDIVNDTLTDISKESFSKTNQAEFQTNKIVNIASTDNDCKEHSLKNAAFHKKMYKTNNCSAEDENDSIKSPNLESKLTASAEKNGISNYSMENCEKYGFNIETNKENENKNLMHNSNSKKSCNFEEKNTKSSILHKDANWESEKCMGKNEIEDDKYDFKTSHEIIQKEIIEKELVNKSENEQKEGKLKENTISITNDTYKISMDKIKESNTVDARDKNMQGKEKTLTLFYINALDYIRKFKTDESHTSDEEKETKNDEPFKNETFKQGTHTKTTDTPVKNDKQNFGENVNNLMQKEVRFNTISSDETNKKCFMTDNNKDLSTENIRNNLNYNKTVANDGINDDNRNIDVLMYDAFSMRSLNNSQFQINIDKTLSKFDAKENNFGNSSFKINGAEEQNMLQEVKANTSEPSIILEGITKQNIFTENSATKNEELEHKNRCFKNPENTFLVTARDCFKTDVVKNEKSSNNELSTGAESEMIYKENESNKKKKENGLSPLYDAENDFEMDDDFTLTASQLSMIETDEKNQIKSLTEEKRNSSQQTSCSNTHFGFDSITVEVINQLSYIRESMESIKEILEKALKK